MKKINKQEEIIALLKENNELLNQIIKIQAAVHCPPVELKTFMSGTDLIMAISRSIRGKE